MRAWVGVVVLLWTMPEAAGCVVESVVRGELQAERLAEDMAAGLVVRVVSSPGGVGAVGLALGRADHLVIDGRCDSTCAWAFVVNSKACFTARARFGFHASHDPGTGARMGTATGYWLDQARPELRTRISVIMQSSRVVLVAAREMAVLYPNRQCGLAVIVPEVCRNKWQTATVVADRPRRRDKPTKFGAGGVLSGLMMLGAEKSR